jgi:hypothetical protein
MAEKQQPVGICDLCRDPIPEDLWYTRRGPRLYCSIDCRNTANSRTGATIRSAQGKQRVKEGRWQNPIKLNPPAPEKQSETARKLRLKEVAEGRWRNPALTDEARAKLSQPRKHAGELHRAMEHMKQGMKLKELAPEERAAYNEYQRSLRAQRKAAMTEEAKEQQRARWRQSYHRYKDKGKD